KIGQVLSRAKTVFSGAGTLTRDADTQVTGMMVGDTPVALTAKGLVVGSSPVPADPKPVEDALAQAKIGLEYMPRQDTDAGVVAPTIRVTQKDDSGGSITYILGRASAFAQGAGTDTPAATPDASTSADQASAGSSDGAATPPAPAAGQAASLTPAAPEPVAGDAGQVDVPTSFVLPDPPVAAGPATTAVEATPAPALIQLAAGGSGRAAAAPVATNHRLLAARLLVSASDTTPMFVVLAAGLLCALGSALVVRRLGKRMR